MQWFYNTRLYYLFRYYFIRKKSPLSYILWSNILKRDLSYSSGILTPFVPRKDERLRIETGINLGAPKDNKIEFDVYGIDGKHVKTFTAQLTYKDAKRIQEAARDASSALLKLNRNGKL